MAKNFSAVLAENAQARNTLAAVASGLTVKVAAYETVYEPAKGENGVHLGNSGCGSDKRQ
ncbi:MAG: hypothetical protein LBD58_06860 [Treponema sp.]|jgi:hypothetical protein|nr:hypothetical protein [Treponema sp.]